MDDDQRAPLVAKLVVGLELERAVEAIECFGLVPRMVEEDGEHLMVTTDLRTDRINLQVEEDTISGAYVG